MVIADVVEVQSVKADMTSSGQGIVDGKAARVAGETIANLIAMIQYPPMNGIYTQLEVCEQCGYDECSSGGYVHISRLADGRVFVSPPRYDLDPSHHRGRYSNPYERSIFLGQNGAAVIAAAAWNNAGLPSAELLPPAEPRDILLAWILEIDRKADPFVADQVAADVKRRFIAAHPADDDTALRTALSLVTTLAEARPRDAGGRLVPVDPARDEVVSLYLEHPDATWWYAVIDGRAVPAFDGTSALVWS